MPATVERVRELAAGYDRASAAGDVTAANEERRQMLDRFPLSGWPTMRLEDYAIGQENSEDSYCRWVEFVAKHLGSIRGGSSHKLIVYKHKNKPGWFFDETVYPNEEEAWDAVRAGFVEALEKAEAGEWDTIDAIPALRRGSALRVKTLYVYFPDELLPIASEAHLRHFLSALACPEADDHSLAAVSLNRALLAALRSAPDVAEWSTKELERLLYSTVPFPTTRMVKIAPGHDAEYWNDCLAGGYVCVGWDDVGDLGDYDSQESFEQAFSEHYLAEYQGNRSIASRKARELWTLVELQPGDIVVANHGTSEILAVGTVVEPGYVWDDVRLEARHTVRVSWDTSFAKRIPSEKRWALVTVERVPERLRSAVLTKNSGPQNGGGAAPTVVPEIFLEIAAALERKGQAVLYGPPGTGKTYHARRFAVWWLRRRAGIEKPEAPLADAENFARAERDLGVAASSRRVWWMVANPSEWSWDELFRDGHVDFRQGRLQRNYPLAQPGDLVVGYQATPDKRIVALARIDRALSSTDTRPDPTLGLVPVCRVNAGLTWEDLNGDELLANAEPIKHRSQGTLFALTSGEAEHLLAQLAERDPDVLSHLGDEVGVAPLTRLTFHPSYSYEEFVEALRPVPGPGGSLELRIADGVFKEVCQDAVAHPDRTYLVLVDEINRANIAKVMGELITLLEKDKRGLAVLLPQSKDRFVVPPNVYLLGTMNTADRSIRLLDVALRRRFAFLELMPDESLLYEAAVGGLRLDEFLRILNARIAEAEGREKQIGHSFLLVDGAPVEDPDEFARIFRYEILPLLQEYSYDNYGELAGYVGRQIVDPEAQHVNQTLLDDPDRLLAALEGEFAPE